MNGEHTCTFVEEREPSGRLIVGPCLGCTKPAFSALADAQATVEALPDQLATIEKDLAPINLGTMTSGDMKVFDKTKALVVQTVMARLKRTLDATTPATHDQAKATVFNEWDGALRKMADVEPEGGDGE